MIINECIEISDKNIVFLSPSPINNKSTCLSSQYFFNTWIFYFVFITKDANANIIIFFNFVNVSSFYWKFYVFKIKSFCKIFVSFCNSCWMMICRISVSDQTPFKAIIIISILNINQASSWLV